MDQQLMKIVIAGHVDHGKSTLMGRLLADTGSLPEGKLEQVRKRCERNAKPFEYAFLVDALREEQAQGITIDAARVFFQTASRRYLIMDAPGHKEFLKNMVTGAARAEAALLVIAADEGIQENSRRHGYMLSLLGVKHIVVVVNKMDLIGYDQSRFEQTVRAYTEFMRGLSVHVRAFIPVSGVSGANIAKPSQDMLWYRGPTVLQALDAVPSADDRDQQPFRMPVQDIYKFTERGDSRRIVAGTVQSGALRVGDQVLFFPTRITSAVKTIEAFNTASCHSVAAGIATGFTLEDPVYVTRGELATIAGQPPPLVSNRFQASLFWMGTSPARPGKDYVFKLGTARVIGRIERILNVMDTSELSTTQKSEVGRFEVAECILNTHRPMAFDKVTDSEATGRFVVVDDFRICGGGIVLSDLPADGGMNRAKRMGQQPCVVWLKGEMPEAKALAEKLESHLLAEGKLPYVLSAQRLSKSSALGETVEVLLDAGLIVLVAGPLAPARLADIQSRTSASRHFVSVPLDGDPGAVENIYDLLKRDQIIR